MRKLHNIELSAKKIVAAVAVVLCVILLWLSASTVNPGHRGVQVTFGSVSSDIRPEGLAWKAPWSSIKNVSIQQQSAAAKTGCYSSDQQQLEVSYQVLYRVPENNVITIFREYPGNAFMQLIKPRIEESLKRVVSTLRAEDTIKERGKVKDETLRRVVEELGGLLTINDLMITNIDLSKELETAIEKKQVAEQLALQMDYELRRAQKTAEIEVVKAEAEAKAIAIRGESIMQSPSVILLNAIEKWDGKAPQTLVVGSETGLSIIPRNQIEK